MDGAYEPTPTTSSNKLSTPWSRLTQSVFGSAALGGILLWCSFPPLNWNVIGWFALLPWISLIHPPTLGGRRPHFQIWMAGFMYWLATLYFIPIPHPALWVGWILMSAALGGYVLTFIAISRQAVWTLRVPRLIAIPMVWTGLEWIRAQTALSFGMVFLSHSQYQNTLLIQVADIGGAYGLSFLMVLAATGLSLAWESLERADTNDDESTPTSHRDRRWGQMVLGVTTAVLAVGFTIGYGNFRLSQSDTLQETPKQNTPKQDTSMQEISKQQTTRTALIIQGSIDTLFPPEDQIEAYLRRQRDDYRRLSIVARQTYPDADLIIWPETIFLQPLFYPEVPASYPRSPSLAESPSTSLLNDAAVMEFYEYSMGSLVDPASDEVPLPPIELLTGIATVGVESKEQFNSIAHITPSGIRSRYDKNHRVMFGEYIPLAENFPALAQLTPIGRGLTPGPGPAAIPLHQKGGRADSPNDSAPLNLLPSVCFESTVPHLIRNHLQQIEANGESIDWLVNLTNDGWFFGTSCLDLHLACNVFRAVELRRPMLVAANTGFSAEIDRLGRIRQQGPRREEGILRVRLFQQPPTVSPYRIIGDWPWLGCGIFVIVGFLTLALVSRHANSTRLPD